MIIRQPLRSSPYTADFFGQGGFYIVHDYEEMYLIGCGLCVREILASCNTGFYGLMYYELAIPEAGKS